MWRVGAGAELPWLHQLHQRAHATALAERHAAALRNGTCVRSAAALRNGACINQIHHGIAEWRVCRTHGIAEWRLQLPRCPPRVANTDPKVALLCRARRDQCFGSLKAGVRHTLDHFSRHLIGEDPTAPRGHACNTHRLKVPTHGTGATNRVQPNGGKPTTSQHTTRAPPLSSAPLRSTPPSAAHPSSE